MSALARLTAYNGHEVSGSDSSAEADIEGVNFCGGHNAANVGGCDLVVYTAAIPKDNIELLAAGRLGIKTVERSEYLSMIERGYCRSIAVSGTHGKTTVSAMLAAAVMDLDPTIHLGGDWADIGGNCRIGGRDIFITEACEYKRSFLTLHPHLAVINNIEPDHMDYFRDIQDIEEAFASFACKVSAGGVIVVGKADERAVRCAERSGRRYVTFGFTEDCTYSAACLAEEKGCYSFCAMEKGIKGERIALKIPGKYNVLNALAAYAAARELKAGHKEIAAALGAFTGVSRRFERKGVCNGAEIINDYAHHPTAVRQALSAAKSIASGKVVAVFQPHTYTRTVALYDGFVDALSLADEICIVPTFASREAPLEAFRERQLAIDLSKMQKKAHYAECFYDAFSILKNTLKQGDILMILGAGDVYKLAEIFTRGHPNGSP